MNFIRSMATVLFLAVAGNINTGLCMEISIFKDLNEDFEAIASEILFSFAWYFDRNDAPKEADRAFAAELVSVCKKGKLFFSELDDLAVSLSGKNSMPESIMEFIITIFLPLYGKYIPFVSLSPNSVRHIARIVPLLPDLETLYLGYCKCTVEALDCLKNHRTLRKLYIDGNPKITQLPTWLLDLRLLQVVSVNSFCAKEFLKVLRLKGLADKKHFMLV